MEAFRKRHAVMCSPEELNEKYPSRSLLVWPPCKKFPTEELINEKLSEIEEELMMSKNQRVKYCGTTIIVFKTENEVAQLIEHYKKDTGYFRY